MKKESQMFELIHNTLDSNDTVKPLLFIHKDYVSDIQKKQCLYGSPIWVRQVAMFLYLEYIALEQ